MTSSMITEATSNNITGFYAYTIHGVNSDVSTTPDIDQYMYKC